MWTSSVPEPVKPFAEWARGMIKRFRDAAKGRNDIGQ